MSNLPRRPEVGPSRHQPPPPVAPTTPLRRSSSDRVFGGVCGGLGHYLNIDPVVVRIIAVALLFAGVGLIAYLIAWIAIPLAEEGSPEPPAPPEARHRTAAIAGAALACVGVLLLLQNLVPMLHRIPFWPMVVVGAGIAVVVVAAQPRR